MRQDCPHCGDSFSALKNHIRLASGNGHGSSGSYPDVETGPNTHSSDHRSEDSTRAKTGEQSDSGAAVIPEQPGQETGNTDCKQSDNPEDSPGTSSGRQKVKRGKVPTRGDDSSSDQRSGLAAIGGLAALAVLSQGLNGRDSDQHRERM